MPKEHRYHCSYCKCSYSVTAKTIFHKTKVDLQKWFFAIKQSELSVRKLASEIEVSKGAAEFMLFRIKKAISQRSEIVKHIKQEL